MDTYKGVNAYFTAERWTVTYSGTDTLTCPNTQYNPHQYNNETLSLGIENGVVCGGEPIGTSGQITFYSNYYGSSWVFTGTINEDAGTASGTWTEHWLNSGCTMDGNGTWSANRMLP